MKPIAGLNGLSIQKRAVIAAKPLCGALATASALLTARNTRTHQKISFYEGVAAVKPPAAAVVAYEALFIFVSPSSLRFGWPGSLCPCPDSRISKSLREGQLDFVSNASAASSPTIHRMKRNADLATADGG
jgi:hypothetical protein